MDVEKCLYNTKSEMQEQKNSQKMDEKGKEEEVAQIVEDYVAAALDNDAVEKSTKLIISRINISTHYTEYWEYFSYSNMESN